MPSTRRSPHPRSGRDTRRRAVLAGVLALALGPLLLALLGAAFAGAPVAVAQEAEGETAEEGAAADPAAEAAEAAGEDGPAPVFHVTVDSAVHPVLANFLEDTVAEADEAGAEALVVELATPGGLVTSTRVINSAFLGARTPVVVWVAPAGSQAASAGFFLLMASDVAAMAPGTNTGAAATVGAQGEDIEGTMGDKVREDAAANIRSLASRRDRNVELAESAVLEARAFTANEALEAGLVELVAPSLASLLNQLDGMEIEKHGRTIVFDTAEAPVREVTMNAFQRVLALLASPDIAMLLLGLGSLGIYFEIANPGSIFPGTVGAICLVLGFFGLSVLPVNYAGLALLLLAIVFFLLEIKMPGFGLPTAAGVVCLVLGALMLFKSPEPALQVSLEVVVAVAIVAVLLAGFLSYTVKRTYGSRVSTGAEGMVTERGVARTGLDPADRRPGKVAVHGELWNAVSPVPVERGDAVEVTAVRGMLLEVRPVAEGAGSLIERTERAGAGEGSRA